MDLINIFSNSFSLLQLETKTTFYKQCWQCIGYQLEVFIFQFLTACVKHAVQQVTNLLLLFLFLLEMFTLLNILQYGINYNSMVKYMTKSQQNGEKN